jgi:phage/plasmid primase-like uncharacterized protein
MTECVGVRVQLNSRIGEVARKLIGEPNAALSTAGQIRYGAKGSLAIKISGPKAGCWFDHEAGVGGDALALICRQLACTEFEARQWARDYLRGTGQAERTKVEEIIQSTTPIEGTSGQQYLRNRGITINLPECIRFRPNAHDSYGAVTALATDGEGDVLAAHQIYVTADGKKAPLQVVKRTNKLTDGWSKRAAVRCPGAKPLVLVEGIETALSVWQATGRETWACLGIANIGHAPVSETAEVIVARDGDAADSPATEQLHKALGNLRRRGVHVREDVTLTSGFSLVFFIW